MNEELLSRAIRVSVLHVTNWPSPYLPTRAWEGWFPETLHHLWNVLQCPQAAGAEVRNLLPPSQVVERCLPGDILLAATRTCVSPRQHNCSSFCHPAGGQLSARLGM